MSSIIPHVINSGGKNNAIVHHSNILEINHLGVKANGPTNEIGSFMESDNDDIPVEYSEGLKHLCTFDHSSGVSMVLDSNDVIDSSSVDLALQARQVQ
ncbi:hypothetical protein V6N11_035429 [Hibiscus sabdariffa]|uniref:Uncharacterized protein n=1 Tax=Hibiscus sabdariffa TaxID=183260 RepID=A0ABR2R075_9ROSI